MPAGIEGAELPKHLILRTAVAKWPPSIALFSISRRENVMSSDDRSNRACFVGIDARLPASWVQERRAHRPHENRRDRTFRHVMDTSFKWPIWIHSFYRIGDEQRIKIHRGDVALGLLDDTCPAGIRASHFQDFSAPLKYL
jgi:hypothetical protein